jgi:Skp family chaperone for outer membrane proteins
MKLQELAVANPTKQAAKVFESYFGNSVNFDAVSPAQARNMLKRVRSLIAEHRRTTGFHSSERNPAYVKLVVMEQALAAAATAPGAAPTAPANPQAQAGMQAAQIQQKKKQIQDTIKAKQAEITQLQKQMNDPTMMAMAEGRRARRLREASEIQQAQVVLASQDMVDQVQKMSEQVSAMQFKDLPALVDQIKNEVGVDQATQFNGDASAALSGLLQNLQGAKQQLESALGVVTGQAPQVPGEDMSAPAPGEEQVDINAELPAPGGEEDIDAKMDANVEPAGLGRERR